MIDEAKKCPFCKSKAEKRYSLSIDNYLYTCGNNECEMISWMPLEKWNNRPLENDLENHILMYLSNNKKVELTELVNTTLLYFGKSIEYDSFQIKACIWNLIYHQKILLDSDRMVYLPNKKE